MYIPPIGSALNFDFPRDRYKPPLGYAVNFKLSTAPDVLYPQPPSHHVELSLPWGGTPRPADAEVIVATPDVKPVDVVVQFDSNNAGRRADRAHTFTQKNARKLDQARLFVWGKSESKSLEEFLFSTRQAPPKDPDELFLRWGRAPKRLDVEILHPFHVLTPIKDREIVHRYFSSAVFAPIWRRENNLPAELARPQPGVANINLHHGFHSHSESDYELAPPFAHHPIQPKDMGFVFRAGMGRAVDEITVFPWGPSGSRDTSFEFDYEDYPGPIDIGGDTITVPTRKVYVVANAAYIVRVSDGTSVPASSVTLSTSTDAFTWSFRATLAHSDALSLVKGSEGEPVEVDVHINNNQWRVLVDMWDTNRVFGRKDIRIEGRSRSAYMAAPYANTRDYIETSGVLAQQLAAQELPPGWTLEWNAPDWFVPAGAWKYQGLSPIQAIKRIATAAGAFVTTDPSQDKVIVQRLYPDTPWNLINLAPDYQVPYAIMTQLSSRKIPGQGVNGVFVFGADTAAYHGEVNRRYSNGEPRAPQVVHPLVTDRNAAEAMGIVAIANASRQSAERYELPVSDSLGGVLQLGALVEAGSEVSQFFNPEWRGLVRGVSVSAVSALGSTGEITLTVRQAIDLVRHFDEGV